MQKFVLGSGDARIRPYSRYRIEDVCRIHNCTLPADTSKVLYMVNYNELIQAHDGTLFFSYCTDHLKEYGSSFQQTTVLTRST